MSNVQAFLYKMFGASWFTSVMGYIVIAGSIAELVVEALAKDGIPTTMAGWLGLITGIGIRFSKQENVSNSPHPIAVAQPVVAAVGDKIAETPMKIEKP